MSILKEIEPKTFLDEVLVLIEKEKELSEVDKREQREMDAFKKWFLNNYVFYSLKFDIKDKSKVSLDINKKWPNMYLIVDNDIKAAYNLMHYFKIFAKEVKEKKIFIKYR